MSAAMAVALLLLSFAGSTLRAQVQRSGGESQKIMQQYQQVAAEKTALQAQLAQMKKDLDAAVSELAAVKKERDAAKAHVGVSPAALAQAQSAKQSAEDSAERSKKQIAELVGRFREVATNLREAEADRGKLREEAVKRSAAYDRCVQDNVQLFAISREVLDRYERVGFFTRASASEPFTQLTRTRIENLVDEYRERAQQLQLSKPSP